MKLYEWQFRQEHIREFQLCLEKTGIVKDGFILKFNGPEFWNMFENELGHDHTEFSKCECWNKFKKYGVKTEKVSGDFVEIY